jgi:nitrile hydratase accessory protein
MSDDFSWIQSSMGSPDSIKEPVFSEPWEADTFAMLVTLEKQNLISWPEWADELGAEIKRSSTSTDTGADYYVHVLSALEKLLVKKRVISTQGLAQYKAGWARVAKRTPHGKPMELKAEDLTPSDPVNPT